MAPVGYRAADLQNARAKLVESYNQILEEFNSDKELRNVGNYRISRMIGKGSFGKVYLATHKLTGAKVVLKSADKSDLNLAREIHHYRQLLHPHIARLYEVVITETLVWLVLEYCPGDELYEYLLRHGALPVEHVQRIFSQLCGAVAYIHGKNIVHRDLKLENILLDKHNGVKLCDFGFTRECEPKRFLQTFCGTMCYAAPEMVRGERYQGQAIDVWSLGIILYALLCGELPFDEEDEIQTRLRISTSDPEYPDTLPTEALDLLQSMLSKRASNRPSAAEVLQHPFLASYSAHSISLISKSIPAPFTSKHERELLDRLRHAFVDIETLRESVLLQKCDNLAGWWALALEQEEYRLKKSRRKRHSRARRLLESATHTPKVEPDASIPIIVSERTQDSHTEALTEPAAEKERPASRLSNETKTVSDETRPSMSSARRGSGETTHSTSSRRRSNIYHEFVNGFMAMKRIGASRQKDNSSVDNNAPLHRPSISSLLSRRHSNSLSRSMNGETESESNVVPDIPKTKSGHLAVLSPGLSATIHGGLEHAPLPLTENKNEPNMQQSLTSPQRLMRKNRAGSQTSKRSSTDSQKLMLSRRHSDRRSGSHHMRTSSWRRSISADRHSSPSTVYLARAGSQISTSSSLSSFRLSYNRRSTLSRQSSTSSNSVASSRNRSRSPHSFRSQSWYRPRSGELSFNNATSSVEPSLRKLSTVHSIDDEGSAGLGSSRLSSYSDQHSSGKRRSEPNLSMSAVTAGPVNPDRYARYGQTRSIGWAGSTLHEAAFFKAGGNFSEDTTLGNNVSSTSSGMHTLPKRQTRPAPSKLGQPRPGLGTTAAQSRGRKGSPDNQPTEVSSAGINVSKSEVVHNSKNQPRVIEEVDEDVIVDTVQDDDDDDDFGKDNMERDGDDNIDNANGNVLEEGISDSENN
ncbi:uncharacterized protein V1516DRAFT_668794 [Lipomyces oligophaga]|uniref:uncharacterized protein n=1 Tax=Lipomyces oligophaga TaxID=45792 RepID=UPI0034CFDAD2